MEHSVARQPIFDRQLSVFAYELLFRSGFADFCDALDGDEASSDVLTSGFILIGLEELTSGKKVSINFTRSLLVNELATLFPADLLLVEILENVGADEEVITACNNLKRAGYCLVLDDFASLDRDNPLLDVVDIVKVDFSKTDPEERRLLPLQIHPERIKYLAEKVETVEEFNQALEWNYSYFQGHFFQKPVVHSAHVVSGSKLVYLRMLNEINKPDADMGEIENIIKQDVSLSYGLLRLMNSAHFGLSERIHSVRHALTLLGVREVKKWISLAMLSGLATDKPEELVFGSLVRARSCEELARKVGLEDRSSELFLLGMFSLIDAIMDKPMSEILSNLPLTEEVKVALMGGENRFRDVYETFLAYEGGDWPRFSRYASSLDLDENAMPAIFLGSVKWVDKVLKADARAGTSAAPHDRACE
jgi:c-di-GMP-related signal transduction protein